MKLRLFLLFVALLPLSMVSATPTMYYFSFEVQSKEELINLSKVISIDNVQGTAVQAFANEEEMGNFRELNYDFELLPLPGSVILPRMSPTRMGSAIWNVYPTYEAYESMMYQFEADYPSLCRIENIGLSVQGRKLLYAKISTNVDSNEDEPEVMYTSSMHGDEIAGYVTMLRLIDSLLSAYGTDARITNMLENMEIWINPLANPDGTYINGNSSVSGAIRYNANSIDLNRNFPDPENDLYPDPAGRQPETMAMMNFNDLHHFVISANFHGGKEVLNYPWDTWPRRHADDNWYIDICRQYANTAQANSPAGYMEFLNNGITNGSDWYVIFGGRQDYMNYWKGCREITIEISNEKLPAAHLLPDYWNYNKMALLDYLEQARFGIRGIVTDFATGLPLSATISVLGHDQDNSEVYTDPAIGDYHRMIEPTGTGGSYTLRASALGYPDVDASNVTVTEGQTTVVNFTMDWICGDVNGNGTVTSGDLLFLIAYVFQGGSAPPVEASGDVNCDGLVTSADIIYLGNYLFQSGPAPCDC